MYVRKIFCSNIGTQTGRVLTALDPRCHTDVFPPAMTMTMMAPDRESKKERERDSVCVCVCGGGEANWIIG